MIAWRQEKRLPRTSEGQEIMQGGGTLYEDMTKMMLVLHYYSSLRPRSVSLVEKL